jgi:hypothetical protein
VQTDAGWRRKRDSRTGSANVGTHFPPAACWGNIKPPPNRINRTLWFSAQPCDTTRVRGERRREREVKEEEAEEEEEEEEEVCY